MRGRKLIVTTSTPDTLTSLLNDVASRSQSLAKFLDGRFGTGDASPEQATVGAQKTFVDDIKTEIAYQAAELLGKGGAISCSEIREVKTLVKSQTTRERALKAACYCRDNSKNGLGDYLVRTPKISRYNADPNKPNQPPSQWFLDLETAADSWTQGDTRNLDQLSSATKAFANAVDNVAKTVDALPAARVAEITTAREAIEAVTRAVLDRWNRLQTADPDGVQQDFPDQQLLKQLNAHVREPTPVENVAEYWNNGKNTIQGKLSLKVLNLTGKLDAWQNAVSGVNPSSANVAATTYNCTGSARQLPPTNRKWNQ